MYIIKVGEVVVNRTFESKEKLAKWIQDGNLNNWSESTTPEIKIYELGEELQLKISVTLDPIGSKPRRKINT